MVLCLHRLCLLDWCWDKVHTQHPLLIELLNTEQFGFCAATNFLYNLIHITRKPQSLVFAEHLRSSISEHVIQCILCITLLTKNYYAVFFF